MALQTPQALVILDRLFGVSTEPRVQNARKLAQPILERTLEELYTFEREDIKGGISQATTLVSLKLYEYWNGHILPPSLAMTLIEAGEKILDVVGFEVEEESEECSVPDQIEFEI